MTFAPGLLSKHGLGRARAEKLDPLRARIILEVYADDIERLAQEIAERRAEPLLEELRRVRNLNEQLLEENDVLRRKREAISRRVGITRVEFV